MKSTQPFISKNESALFYECGYSCDNAWLLKHENTCFFITDSRYTLEAKQCCHSHTEIIESNHITQSLIDLIIKLHLKELICDSAEISFEDYQTIQQKTSISLQGKPHFHQHLRILKTDKEIEKIKTSQQINTQAYEALGNFLQSHYLKPNQTITEKFLQFQAKIFLQNFGDYDLSFEPILAINANAAKPHALPTNDILKPDDLILFDAGIKFQRYCSDRTRTTLYSENISFQKDQKFKDTKIQQIYDIVRKAQEHTITHIRAGMSAKEVDALARNIISNASYGNFFTHSTGHGIGLDIHEMPYISPRSQVIIEEGMVFSIEPGIYLPHQFGIRIEDLVVIKNSRAEIL